MTTDSLQPGLVLADQQYEIAATRHLQSRLKILYGVMAAAALGFYVAENAVPAFEKTWTWEHVTKAGALAELGTVLLTGTIFALLSLRPVARPLLWILDAIALGLGAAACLATYAFDWVEGSRDIVALLAVFVIARAVVIPSLPWATFLLCLPIAGALAWIDLSHDYFYTYDNRIITDAEAIASLRVWNQIVLFFGVAVATVASWLTTALRARLDEAKRLGQYQLDKKIGEGGMGEVYLATHATLKRPTAIKLLRPELMGEEALARFRREVRLASRLTHANTIRIFDYGRTPEGVFYYAMEHVRGLDLATLVQRAGPFPPARVVHVLERVCRSLAEAHELGLVHRDVKPGNIMLCTKGGEYDVVKLVDFGLAKDLGDARTIAAVDGSICGTPETISPETLRGEPASPACDLYALGAVGVFLLTGQPIFDSKTPLGLLNAHLTWEPVPPSQRGVEVSEELEELLMSCLSKDPISRPYSALALGEALRACKDVPKWTERAAAEWWADYAEKNEGAKEAT